MKLILTESQWTILESIIDEASVPMSTNIDKGGYIQVIYAVGDNEKSTTLKVTNVYGGGKYIEGTNNDGRYIINVAGSLDKNNNTFTVVKNGEYKEGEKTEGGKLLAPRIVGGNRIELKNILQVNISNSSKNVTDEILTDLGNEKNVTGDESESDLEKQQKEREKRAEEERDSEERIRDLVMNDPTLRKAFRHQPKIFGGLLNYGKARGIGPALDLIDKYIKRSKDDETKDKDGLSKFKVNENLLLEIAGKPIRISYGNDSFNLLVGKKYPATYIGSQYLKGTHDKKHFNIKLKENKGGDIYSGTIRVLFKEDDGSRVEKFSDITMILKTEKFKI